MNEKPLYKLIEYLDETFLYDTNTNEVISISRDLYKHLKKANESTLLSNPTEIKSEIEKLISKSYLDSNKPSVIKHPQTYFIKSLLGNLKKITLQVTQACNFKCRYCGYAGENYLNRHHNGQSMTWDVAQNAIDFFIANSINTSVVYVGFYGGEPLLELELIKKCIEYIEQKLYGKKIEYYITSNGSLINEKVVELVNRYPIHLTISLDGPKEMHNKNRRYAMNGGSTYDDVIEAIRYLKNNVSDYKNKVTINSVIDQQENYYTYYSYFNTENAVSDIFHSENLIDDSRLNRNISISNNYLIPYTRQTINSYIKLLSEEYSTDAVTYSILKDIEELSDRFTPTDKLSDTFHHAGPCVPGYNRLFVTVDGTLFPCEKCSENSKALKIGDIFNGYDYSAIEEILNIGWLTEEQCKNCVIMRHCTVCAQQIDDICGLSVERKLSHCKNQEQVFIRNLKKYIILSKIGLINKEK